MAKVGDLVGTLIKVMKPKLQVFMHYAKVELVPPSPSEIPEIKNGIVKIFNTYKNGTWKQLTVRTAFLNTLVATEVVCWFYIGECIGKRHIIGYELTG